MYNLGRYVQIGGRVVKNTTRILYKGCIFLKFEVQQHVLALYGHHQVLSIEVSLYRLREKGCDVEISYQIIVRICLCIGGYYATLIHPARHPRMKPLYQWRIHICISGTCGDAAACCHITTLTFYIFNKFLNQ